MIFQLDWVVFAKTVKNCSFKPFLWLYWQRLDYFWRDIEFFWRENHGTKRYFYWLPAPVSVHFAPSLIVSVNFHLNNYFIYMLNIWIFLPCHVNRIQIYLSPPNLRLVCPHKYSINQQINKNDKKWVNIIFTFYILQGKK